MNPTKSKLFRWESPFCVVIDGNIGVGKSSVLDDLKQMVPSFRIIQEPVEAYSYYSYNSQTFNPLACMYQKQAETAIVQDFIIDQSYKHYDSSLGFFRSTVVSEERDRAIVCERHVLSAHPFISTYHQKGALSDFAAAYLHNKVDNFSVCSLNPNLVIFLDLPSKDAKVRIDQRERVSEGHLDLEFLDLLQTNMLQFYRDLEAREGISLIVMELKAEWPAEYVAEKVSVMVKACITEWRQELNKRRLEDERSKQSWIKSLRTTEYDDE